MYVGYIINLVLTNLQFYCIIKVGEVKIITDC